MSDKGDVMCINKVWDYFFVKCMLMVYIMMCNILIRGACFLCIIHRKRFILCMILYGDVMCD